jgi:hypothetical protein
VIINKLTKSNISNLEKEQYLICPLVIKNLRDRLKVKLNIPL